MAETQELITDLRIKDNLSVGLQKAKSEVSKFGNTAASEAVRTEKAFTGAADAIRGRFATLGADLKKGIGVGLGFGGVQLAAQGVRELTQAIGHSVNAARDLTETINKSKVVFGPAAAEIEKFGATSATALGLSTNAAIGFAATFGNLFVSLGVGGEKIAPMSQALVTLGSDLASFNNIQTDEALTSLRAALVGEFEPARRLGVALNALTVEAKATELGFTKVNGAFTEGDKVAARYALIMDQTGTAQGDFARTSQDLANQQRILDAQLENVSAKLGKLTTPILTELARILNNEVLPALGKLSEDDLPSFAEDSEREIKQLTEALQFIASPLGNLADLWRSNNELIGGGAAAAATASVASTDLTASFVAQERAMLLAAQANAILTGDTAQAKAAQHALDEAAAAVTTEMNKQAAAVLANTKTAELNIQRSKAWAAVQLENAENTAFFTAKVLTAADAAEILARNLAKLPSSVDIAVNITTTALRRNVEETAADTSDDARRFFVARQNEEFRLAQEARAAALAAEKAAAARQAASEAEAARSKALSEAKAKAQERYNKTLQNTKDIATTLFDAQHARTLRAIKDTETLAQKQHDGALQQISDALKVRLDQNAAPVTEAEQNQQRIELARQRRDLAEALAQARRGGDPGAIRSAQEAIQSFQAQQGINALRLEQAKKDAAAQEEARIAQKAADDQLAAAKIASAKDIEAENLRSKTQRARFDKELEALKRRDAGASPAKIKADIAKLEEKFGITTDAKGFHHIADVLETVAKDLKPTLTGIGDAAAGATPGLAAVGSSATAAADGLAVFAKRLGEFAIVEPHLPRETTTPVIRDSDDDLLAAIKNLKLSPIIQPTFNVEIAEPPKPVDIDRLLAAISAQKEKAQPKDDLSPMFKDIGDAAATATPKLAGLASAEVTLGRESVTAADGLAIFARSLGELKVLELPVPKPVALPDIPQPVTVLDQPRLSEAEILASAIKNLTLPVPVFNPTINVYVAGSTLNGRLVGAAMASSQSPSATPGIRTGTLSPRP